jgi:phosphoglycerate kinase
LRADLDAPHANGEILDGFRIRQALPTIKFLQSKDAKIVIISKTGKPKGEVTPAESLAPIAKHLVKLLGNPVDFLSNDLREQKTLDKIKEIPNGIILLENIRFYPEELSDDVNFAKELAQLGDVYVDDAFAMVHRNETSVAALPRFLTSYAGLNLEKEVKNLQKVLDSKRHPFVIIMGGAKISDKVGTIKNLGRDADYILLGGGPANLFFFAKGFEIGKSICEKESVEVANELLRNFKDKIILPVDVVVAQKKEDGSFDKVRVCKPDEVKSSESILDIGPQTILEFSKRIKKAKKIVWNGPMGLFENKTFSHGTRTIALIFAAQCKGDAFCVAGGGDTLEAIHQSKVFEQVDFVSTAGGAMLDFLAGENLPGLKALNV